MYLAILKKELREIAPTALIAAVAFALVVADAMKSSVISQTPLREIFSTNQQWIAFVSESFFSSFVFLSLAFVTILGFQQSLAEEWRGTYRLFLHRRLSRNALFGLKLIAGASAYLFIGAVAFLSLALWAATPGMQPAPFFWSMTAPTIWAWLAAPLVYLGAFLSAVRPSRWYGTKLLPWIVSMAAFGLTLLIGNYSALILLIGIPLLVSNILWVARQRDFS